MDLEIVQNKVQAWTSKFEQYTNITDKNEKEKFGSTWLPGIVTECYELLNEYPDPEIAGVILEFLYHACVDTTMVEYAFGHTYGYGLCSTLKKFLTFKVLSTTALQEKVMKVLISVLQTVVEEKRKFAPESSTGNILTNVPVLMIKAELDHFVTNCLSSTSVDLINKCIEFFRLLMLATTCHERTMWPILTTCLRSFMLVLSEPRFDRSTGLKVLTLISKNLNEITPDFQEKLRVFGALVLESIYWSSEEKIECLTLLDICRTKICNGYSMPPKINLRLASIVGSMNTEHAEFETLPFVKYLLKNDFNLPSLNFPELDDLTDPYQVNEVMHLLFSICFTLQNMYFKAMLPKQASQVWELMHEFFEFLIRKSKTGPEKNHTFITYLENIVNHSSTILTLRKLILGTVHPKEADLMLLKFLLTWTKALTILVLDEPKSSGYTDIAFTGNTWRQLYLELGGWIEVFYKNGNNSNNNNDDATSQQQERTELMEAIKMNVKKLQEEMEDSMVHGAPSSFPTLDTADSD